MREPPLLPVWSGAGEAFSNWYVTQAMMNGRSERGASAVFFAVAAIRRDFPCQLCRATQQGRWARDNQERAQDQGPGMVITTVEAAGESTPLAAALGPQHEGGEIALRQIRSSIS